MSLDSVIAWILAYKYAVIFPLAIAEGPVLTVICGFLLRLGYFNFLPLYLILLAGDLAGDFFWYGAGRYGAKPLARRYGRYVNLTDEVMDKIELLFRKHENKILLISKMTMGLGFALVTLMIAGASKVSFKKYAILNTIGGIVWTGLLVALGYFFGAIYTLVDRVFGILFIIFAITMIVLALHGFKRYLQKRFMERPL